MLPMSRIPAVVGVIMLIAAALPAGAADQPSAFHLVVVSSRSYMGVKRDQTFDIWVAEGKRSFKRGTRIRIMREDLGLTWDIDESAKRYVEERDEPAGQLVKGIHTLGFEHTPVFDWQAEARDEAREISGFACRVAAQRGEDDFSDATVALWTTPTHSFGDVSLVAKTLLGLLNAEAETASARELLRQDPGALLVEVELSREAPIASRSVIVATVQKIERAKPPAGIFELPAGYSKDSE
jgi:hypothetical protein